MPHAKDGATPKNMGTQCENIDIENQNTVRNQIQVSENISARVFTLQIHF